MDDNDPVRKRFRDVQAARAAMEREHARAAAREKELKNIDDAHHKLANVDRIIAELAANLKRIKARNTTRTEVRNTMPASTVHVEAPAHVPLGKALKNGNFNDKNNMHNTLRSFNSPFGLVPMGGGSKKSRRVRRGKQSKRKSRKY